MINSDDSSLRKHITRVWKVLSLLAQIVCGASGLGAIALWMYYDYTRPTVAEPSSGRIYELGTHGSLVYLTQAEKFRLEALMWIFGVFAVVAVLISLFCRPFP